MLFTYASRVRSLRDCALEGYKTSEVPMATLLTPAAMTTHALTILERTFRPPRKHVPNLTLFLKQTDLAKRRPRWPKT